MMEQSPSHSKTFGYVVIAIGLALAFISAVVPHYGHHQLLGGVLAVGLLPYLAYGVIVVFLNSTVTMASGVVVLLVHAALVFVERFGGAVEYNNDVIYIVPVVVTLALLPLVVMALRKPWHL